MKNRGAVLLFWFLCALSAYAESPVHGIWLDEEVYTTWQRLGGNVYETGEGLPYERNIEGKMYVYFSYQTIIRNDLFRAGDSGSWDILFFEESVDRIIYHLASCFEKDSGGTITIILIAEDIIYFDSYQGDDNFVREVRHSSLRFGEEYRCYRVRGNSN